MNTRVSHSVKEPIAVYYTTKKTLPAILGKKPGILGSLCRSVSAVLLFVFGIGVWLNLEQTNQKERDPVDDKRDEPGSNRLL